MHHPSLPLLLLLLPIFTAILALVSATVSPKDTFTYVNSGEYGPYVVEYDGTYRTLTLSTSPFQLCFYNTTPNAFTLALRMATTSTESLFRWVWEANRGHPVPDNATLSFLSDGNLLLAHPDGTIAWQTRTAGRGVTGLKILPNGNIVLHDGRGKKIWQSFHHPTDTILVGQTLSRLVSRSSASNNSDGDYTLVMEKGNLSLYYKTIRTPFPLLYFTREMWSGEGGEELKFNVSPDTDQGYAYNLELVSGGGGSRVMARPKYNCTLSFLRLGVDGNLRIFTYYQRVSWGAWEVTYRLFGRGNDGEDDECQMPERCGALGVCEESQCVGCPVAEKRMMGGWSRSCRYEGKEWCGGKGGEYYKMEGVEHFMSRYMEGIGPEKEGRCRRRCSGDCKCLGYFYNGGSSTCWIAHELKTMRRVANSTVVAFIKV